MRSRIVWLTIVLILYIAATVYSSMVAVVEMHDLQDDGTSPDLVSSLLNTPEWYNAVGGSFSVLITVMVDFIFVSQ